MICTGFTVSAPIRKASCYMRRVISFINFILTYYILTCLESRNVTYLVNVKHNVVVQFINWLCIIVLTLNIKYIYATLGSLRDGTGRYIGGDILNSLPNHRSLFLHCSTYRYCIVNSCNCHNGDDDDQLVDSLRWRRPYDTSPRLPVPDGRLLPIRQPDLLAEAPAGRRTGADQFPRERARAVPVDQALQRGACVVLRQAALQPTANHLR